MTNNDKKIRELIIEKFMSNTKNNIIFDEIEEEDTAENENNTIINDIQEEDSDEEIEKDEKYNYLNDEELNRDFIFDSETIGSSSIAICLYRINNESVYPFLEFYCKKENAIYDFPSQPIDINKISEFIVIKKSIEQVTPEQVTPEQVTPEQVTPTQVTPEQVEPTQVTPTQVTPTQVTPTQVTPTQVEPTQVTPTQVTSTQVTPTQVTPEQLAPEQVAPKQKGGYDQNDINNMFFEKCSLIFQSITQKSNEIALENYKGYLKLKNNTYIAVFDCTNLDIENDSEIQSIWAILDEITNKKRILDLAVSENMSNLFYENPLMMYITNSSNAVEIPLSVYICQSNNNRYNNLHYAEENNQKTESLINQRVIHSIFGSTYLFTTEPIEYNNLSNIKRFALFSNSVIYLLNKDIPIEEYKSQQINEYTSICFYEDNSEFWSIKDSNLFIEL